MHFYIEHNKGHHKRVATPEDPGSARLGENLYSFYFRSIIFSYTDAWTIATRDVRKKGHSVLSLHNEMVVFQLLQILLLVMIWIVAGPLATLLFAVAACQGILLLETVNYIEHYGLQRMQLADGKYERAMPVHSWNSNHVLGRLMLFELSRHSDHHYLASRKYQVLRHHGDSPQMPTGYPGMMLLATIPPLWFRIMNKRVRSLQNSTEREALRVSA
jgi:alkane 1-monooxygenase